MGRYLLLCDRKCDCCLTSPLQVELPGSKSLSNRVLLLAALSAGTIQIDNLLDSADIQYMLSALKQLKVSHHLLMRHIHLSTHHDIFSEGRSESL